MSLAADGDCDLVRLRLFDNGATMYQWRSDDRRPLANVLEIKSSSSKAHKGVGIYNASPHAVPQSSILFTNAAIAATTISHSTSAASDSSLFCQRCLKFIPPKVMGFSRPDCRHLTFCSRSCLALSDHMLSAAASVIGGLLNNSTLQRSPQASDSGDEVCHASSVDSAVLLVLWSYALVYGDGTDTEQSRSTAQSARECLRLFAGDGTETDNHTAIAEAIVGEMRAHAPRSFLEALAAWAPHGLTALVLRMVSIIRFNAQPMPVSPEGTGPTILFLVPTIPRLNHSCSPNARLLLEAPTLVAADSADSHRRHLQLSVIALRDIAPGEEVTMSYLDNLCVSVGTRRSLLQQAFAFRCDCRRCRWEESLASTSPALAPSPPSKLSSTIRELHDGLQAFLSKRLRADAENDRGASLDDEQLALLRHAQSLHEQLDALKQAHKKKGTVAVPDRDAPGPLLRDVATAAAAARPLVPEIPTMLRDAAGIVLQNFTHRFQVLQQRHRAATASLPSVAAEAARSDADLQRSVLQYLSARSGLIAYGMWFVRSGQLVALAYEQSDAFVGRANIKRLEIMAMTALYGAVTARAYVEGYDQLHSVFAPLCRDERTLQRLFLQVLPSPQEMLEAVRGGLNMAIDAILTIKTVFLTATNAAHRQALGCDAGADSPVSASPPTSKPAFQDLWCYLEDLHGRAWKAKRYCATVFEKVGELHDSFATKST